MSDEKIVELEARLQAVIAELESPGWEMRLRKFEIEANHEGRRRYWDALKAQEDHFDGAGDRDEARIELLSADYDHLREHRANVEAIMHADNENRVRHMAKVERIMAEGFFVIATAIRERGT